VIWLKLTAAFAALGAAAGAWLVAADLIRSVI
jgi:hypothetical protein